jgi:Salmonella virulence plasmid 65kDa B protein
LFVAALTKGDGVNIFSLGGESGPSTSRIWEPNITNDTDASAKTHLSGGGMKCNFLRLAKDTYTSAVARITFVVLVAGATAAQAATVAGSTPGQIAVAPTGAAQYTVPIVVPPGIAGVEPRLALTYNSQANSGLVGMGWRLSG